jgi:hypothetical protein
MVKGDIDLQECFDLWSRWMECSWLKVLYNYVTKFEIGDQVLVKDENIGKENRKLEASNVGPNEIVGIEEP